MKNRSFRDLMDLLLDGFIDIYKITDYGEPIVKDFSLEEYIWSRMPEEMKEFALNRKFCELYFKLKLFKDEDNFCVAEYLNYIKTLNN